MDFSEEELLQEEWREIKQLPGFQVSSLGRIRDNQGKIRKVQNHIRGYQFLVLSLPLHRLVCEAFHEQSPFTGAQVLHGPDHDKHNNRSSNLRWGTAQDNTDDCMRAGRARFLRGEEHGRAKLTWDLVKTVRARYRAGELIRPLWREIGKPLGINYAGFYKMATGMTWKEETCE